jgi:hypothetical protein
MADKDVLISIPTESGRHSDGKPATLKGLIGTGGRNGFESVEEPEWRRGICLPQA